MERQEKNREDTKGVRQRKAASKERAGWDMMFMVINHRLPSDSSQHVGHIASHNKRDDR